MVRYRWIAWGAGRTGSATASSGTSPCTSGSRNEVELCPAFCFLGQPSQGYFPPEKDVDGSMALIGEDDRHAVSRMFRFVFKIVESLTPGFQVIITEHADIN